jgi:hypothetical protein
MHDEIGHEALGITGDVGDGDMVRVKECEQSGTRERNNMVIVRPDG